MTRDCLSTVFWHPLASLMFLGLSMRPIPSCRQSFTGQLLQHAHKQLIHSRELRVLKDTPLSFHW